MVDDAKIEPRALVGKWHFERDIVDRLSGSTKHVFGETTISDAGDGLMRWYESGTLRDGDLELPVFRTLFVAERGLEWAVTFEDGREFHDWAPGEEVEHLCGADTYRGRIDVTAGDRSTWTVVWTVTGPSKDYTMTTHLTRP
ncbi:MULTISPECIES: DUF6314 family protein [Rhodococcus]|uniref:DUF6314 family protein n=1 Tax=Rhodococcus TaxID=1827 RepID=UPI0007DB3709|nr:MULTISPECIES: DUF6314 family protein [Rhodococcus]UXF69143.1 DUF6314 family protein [Rhodococcus qingshengii]